MVTNATVLIVVTALAALVLCGALAVVMSKTRTSRRPVRGATVQRSEADTSHDQLNDLRDQADGFSAAAQTRQLPRPIGLTTL